MESFYSFCILGKPQNKMKKFDTVITVSGFGGLSKAICLSRAGQKVLVPNSIMFLEAGLAVLP
jgi:hypothetical protein